MSKRGFTFVVTIVGVVAIFGVWAHAQENPYREVENWAQLPEGREWGATGAVYPAGDGNIWVAERCGGNFGRGNCVDRPDVPPILLFDSSGKLLKSFGEGIFVIPHGIYVDRDGNVWVTDAAEQDGKGHQVHKFSPNGRLLMSLGKTGVAGEGNDTFNRPSDVLVAPNGDIFVADGHGTEGNNRVVKFSSDGRFIKTWGNKGSEPGEFSDPHALAMDSQGRLFVGDRRNGRIQIFDQEGNYIAQLKQFGQPHGIFIVEDDTIYVAASDANRTPGKNGIGIGKIKDDSIRTFIPDPPEPSGGAEGVAVDARGNVYGAETGLVGMLRKYTKR